MNKSALSILIPRVNELSSLELREVCALLDSIIYSTPSNISFFELLSTLRSSNHNLIYKSLLLYVLRCKRELDANIPSEERISAVRDLKNLRAQLDVAPHDQYFEATAHPETKSALEGDSNHSLREAISQTYKLSVGREPIAEEITIWLNHFRDGVKFHQFLLGMLTSPEAQSKPALSSREILTAINNGEFVQIAYELILGRGAKAWEIDLWREKIENSSSSRSDVLAALFTSSYQLQIDQANAKPHDGSSCLVMGTGTHVSITDWEYKAKALAGKPQEKTKDNPNNKYNHRFSIHGHRRILVSALASLYRGGDFIEQFMDNITGQNGFDDWCELVIIDAESPEKEFETIKRYLSHHKNINYIRCNYRIGIYDAWNVAAKAARGEYLTNTNLDDLRRHDSFMLQAATLDNLKFVDIVYQDLYYTFDPRLTFEQIADFGLQTTLPVITIHNMLDFNSPHNAPMWRKRLHDEVGYFDCRYRSAGDYDFWLRCLVAGKKFYKINDPHVVYYQNPRGLSTRPDTRGLAESMEISKAYARKLVPNNVVVSRKEFMHSLSSVSGDQIVDSGDRYHLVQQSLRNIARSIKYAKGN
ncbi:MAG: DUF4214 domain-containing protein [Nitrosomonas sp.]|nr:MAG: DUF4214 domain-containing protein [Nitrosomonas sp.]